MEDFRVIDGGGADKEDRERKQEWANGEFSWALRDCAANMLRVVRGAGKPYDLLKQMQEVVNSAIKYREAHGHYPSSDVIQSKLALKDEYVQERQNRGEVSEEFRNIRREEGEVDRLFSFTSSIVARYRSQHRH